MAPSKQSVAENIDVDDDAGFTKIITPINPNISPKICFRVTFSPNHNKAIIIVLNAVVAFRIARIFESAPKLPNENNVNGIALFVIAKIIECLHTGLNNKRYFFLNKRGINTKDAIVSLACTKPTAPNSGAAILIKIKALPQIAPSNVRTNQYLISIIKNKNPQINGG